MPKQGISTEISVDWVGKIWLKHSAKIYKLCTAQTHSEEAAKDLFQEVALKFCRNYRYLNLNGPLTGWFRRVVRTTFYDAVRRTSLETPMSTLKDEQVEYNAYPEKRSIHYTDDVREEWIQNAVDELLQKLAPAEKMVVEGSYIVGLTLSEMSRDFGVSRCVLCKKRNDALLKMRKMNDRAESVPKKGEMPALVMEKLLT